MHQDSAGLLASSLARPRLFSVLLAGFAIATPAVTGVGLFGVLSYTVSPRTRELGVRATLGARPLDLVVLVLRQAIGVAGADAAVGVVVSLGTTGFMSTLLYGVSARDWVTYTLAPVVLLAVAVLACATPAIRAGRLDPLRAPRS